MKKMIVVFVLALGAVVLAIGVCRVAAGRGLSGETSKPAVKEAKQPEAKQTEITPPETKNPETKKPAPKQPETQSKGKPDDPVPQISAEALKNAETDPGIVALIADYVITRGKLEDQLLSELDPSYYEESWTEATNAGEVLIKLVADKAVIMEGRKNGVLETDTISKTVKNFKDSSIVNLLMQKEILPGLTVTEAEIQENIKADPDLDHAKAEQIAKRAKVDTMMTQYYADLYKKSDVKKTEENFAKAAEIYKRLLLRPKVKRDVAFVRNSQINDELSDTEKNMTMATFKGGKVTLEDWFIALGEIPPRSRPRDLHTTQEIDKLLERALRTPILVAEAARQGLDKDEDLKKQVREYEDRLLLNDGRQNKRKEVVEPNAEQIKAYFEQNKDRFAERRNLKVDQIWCSNSKAAKEAKTELDEGKDFASIKQKYSFGKQRGEMTLSPRSEAYFWPELWKAEPNDVVGPIKGRHIRGFKWRLVRIIEKNPGTIPELSENVASRVKRTILNERSLALMNKYNTQLLEKYPHKIYTNRIKDIDPLAIP
jgi:hypothetical protein